MNGGRMMWGTGFLGLLGIILASRLRSAAEANGIIISGFAARSKALHHLAS